MKIHHGLYGLVMLLFLSTSCAAVLTVGGSGITISQLPGETFDYQFNLASDHMVDNVTLLVYGQVPSTWFSFLPTVFPYRNLNNTITIHYLLSVPTSQQTTTLTSGLRFTDNESNIGTYTMTLNVLNPQQTTTTTTLPDQQYPWMNTWDKMVKSVTIGEDDGTKIVWGDDDEYQLYVYSTGSSGDNDWARLRIERDDRTYATNTFYADDVKDMGSHYKAEVTRVSESSGKVRLSLWTDTDYKAKVINETTLNYDYTLLSGQNFPVGTVLTLGDLQIKLEYIAYNGVYISSSSASAYGLPSNLYGTGQGMISCVKGQQCEIVPGIRVIIDETTPGNSVIGQNGLVRLTIKSNQNVLVRTQLGGTTGSNTNIGTSYSGSTTTNKVSINLCGGRVAPRAKAIFCITQNSAFGGTATMITTGTFILNTPTAKSVDIRQGFAEVYLPTDLTCPLTVTAVVDGQPTMQLINSCDQTGSTAPAGGSPGEGDTYSCFDNIKNGDEEAVDCGGSCTKKCVACSDGIQNFLETGVDCGGPCTAVCPKPISISVSDGSPYINTNINAVMRDSSTNNPLDGCSLEISKPGGGSDIKTTDAGGTVSINIDTKGQWNLRAYKTGYVEARTTIQGRQHGLILDVQPQKSPYAVGDVITINVRDDQGSVSGAIIKVGGKIVYGSATLDTKGAQTISADKDGYDSAAQNIEVKEETRLLSGLSLEVGKNSTIKLNNAVPWEIQKDGQQIAYGTGDTIVFTPTESGTYSVVAESKTLATADASGFNWMIILGVLGGLILVLFFMIIRKGSKTRTSSKAPKIGEKTQDLEEVLEKLRQGKTEITTYN